MTYVVEADVEEAIEGLTRIAKETIPDAIEATLELAAEEAIRHAQMFCPVDTGLLRSTITILDQGDDYIVIGTDLHYAIYVEFGTYKMAAQPYIGPVADAMNSRFSQIFAEELASRLDS